MRDIYGVKLKALEEWNAEAKRKQSVEGDLLNSTLCN